MSRLLPLRPLAFAALLLVPVLPVHAAKPLVTDAELAAAEATGNLPALYNQAKAELVGKDRNNKRHAPLFAQLDSIGRTLAGRLDSELRGQVDKARMHNGIVPLNVLNDVKAAGEPMRTWQPDKHDIFVKDIDRDLAVTEKAVSDIQAYVANLAPTALRKHMEALRQLALVTGDTSYSEKRETMLNTLRGGFEQARSTDDFEKALALLDELPVDDSTEPTRMELQARLFERRFNEALADDRPDEAYKLFDALAKSPRFADVKARIAPTANDMANYFVALAAKAVAENNMREGYHWFAQARDVHMKLNGRAEGVPEEKPFVDRIYRGYEKARTESLWPLALGHLLLVQEFDPTRPDLSRALRGAEEEVAKLAIRSATVAPFNSAAGNADYSGAIATRITENLFQNIPYDLRIIAYDATQAASVDYVISGNIDEARVESSQNVTRKTTRAVTEAGMLVRNPKYDEWLKLSERQRRDIPQPAPQLPVDKKEDISYNVTTLRKVGYFSVAFRIVEATSGKVVHTDSLTLKRELTDEGNEGVELGDFQLPAKTPNLPTDLEILNKLSGEASQEIGNRLGKRLGNLEQRYADVGKKAATNSNPLEAAQNYGMAVVVAQRKGVNAEALRDELKNQTVLAGYAR